MNFEYNPNEQLDSKEEPVEREMGSFGIDKEIEENIIEKMNNGFDERVIAIAKENNVSDETLKEIAKQDILDNFETRNHKDTILKAKYYGIDQDLLKNENFIELGKDRVVLKLSQGDINSAYGVLKDLNIDEKFLDTKEAVRAAEAGIQAVLAVDNIDKAMDIKDTFNIDDAFMEGAVKTEIKIRLLKEKELTDKAIDLQERFNISQDFMKEAIKEEVLSRLSFGSSLNSIANFVNKLTVDVSFLNDEKIKEAIRARIDGLIEEKGQEKIPDIFKELNITKDESNKIEENS